MVCDPTMFVCTGMYIYIYLSQSNIDASIDCIIGKMVQLISQSLLWAAKTGADCKLAAL